MKKSVILFTALVTSMLPFHASAAEKSVDVHVTIEQESTVLDKDIHVTDFDGDGRLTSEDALLLAHELYYPGGVAYGYADEGFIWGLRGEYFYSNIAAGETFDPLLHAPREYRRDLENGDHLTWEIGCVRPELCIINSQELDSFKDNQKIPFGTEIHVIVSRMIPNQPMDEPAVGVELTFNGEKTGIFTNQYGWATITLNQEGSCSIGALTEEIGVPLSCERYFDVAQAEKGASAAADAAAPIKKPAAANTSAAKAEQHPAAVQNVSPQISEDVPVAQPVAVQAVSAPTAASSEEDVVPKFLMALIGISVSVFTAAMISVFRKLH